MIWGPILAGYLFLAGLSAGAYAIAALANFKNPEATRKFQLGGRLIAPATVIVGLLLLVFDAEAGVHNPLRFFFLFTNWGSVMTWGSAILSIYTLVACISALLALLKKPIAKVLDYIGIFLAFCTAAYTGVLIGVVETYPLWNTSLLPALFVVSGFSTGISITFLAASFLAPQEAQKLVCFKKLHFALPVIEIFLIAVFLYIAWHGSSAGADSVNAILTGNFAALFWGGLIVVGLVVPIVLELVGISLVKKHGIDSPITHGRGMIVAEILGCVCTLAGGFILRYLILMAAVPAQFLF